MAEQEKNYRSGFVGIVGPTNAGKSTLMNALLGRKLSIVSPKAQTTYHGVRGVLSEKTGQMVLTDTPGMQGYREPIARLLNRVAEKQAKDCDALAWVFDASNPRVLQQVDKLKDKIAAMKPKEMSILVLNKADKIPKPSLLPMIAELVALNLFKEIIPVSALKKDNLDRLARVMRELLPEGQPMYPDGMVTDRPESFLITEFIREKIYQATRQEVPYSVWIELEEKPLDEAEGRVPIIRAVIHVDSSSRKGILVGKGGEMLKRIGSAARKDIEELLGKQVCLKLHVDVHEGWRDNANHLHRYLELE